MTAKLYLGDCLDVMARLPDASVDMVLCDLPYGTTACKWDSVIPFEPLWEAYRRIAKPNAAIVLTASQPFTTALIASNAAEFRYCLIWDKTRGSDFQNARKRPMKAHEDVAIFYASPPVYNPQHWFSRPYATSERRRSKAIEGLSGGSAATVCAATVSEDGRRYPLSIIRVPRDGDRLHPTQKPVALMEYLVRTYTNAGETVLDNCMGSGTTGVACASTGRDFIGIERDPAYFAIAERRINGATEQRLAA